MRIEKIRTEEAVGRALFHDMTAILDNGEKGVRFRRGHILQPADIPELLKMGKEHIFIEQEDPDWVHEEEAIAAVFAELVDEQMELVGPAEGKLSLRTTVPAVLEVNRPALRTLNHQPEYSLVCRPSGERLGAGEIFAAGRVVPLVVPKTLVEETVEMVRFLPPIFRLHPLRPKTTGIVVTGNEIYKGLRKDRFEEVLRAKLQRWGLPAPLPIRICPDEEERIQEAVLQLIQEGAEVILLTGGMSVDPDDLTPTVIRKLSSRFLFQGVPMQPGNMLTLGYRDQVALIGVPGASLHAEETAFDHIVPWVYAEIDIQEEDVLNLAEGGLLK